eukprot:m51a1_g14174 hypothetical protein (437) ;mRNA; f:28037-29432
MRAHLLPAVAAVACALVCACLAASDDRAYQHGVDFVRRPDGKYWLIWSSSGNPPTGPDAHDAWTDDVYSLLVDPANPAIDPSAAATLISAPEAQEPASSAATDDGRIMVTMEDGYNATQNLCQRYGVYDSDLGGVRAYPQMVQDGGHSGHVAAAGDRFVVVYADDWTDEGKSGVCLLGEGLDVKSAIYDSSGRQQGSLIDVATGDERDWWPYVAGSKTRAVYLWQRYIAKSAVADLYAAVIDPATARFVKAPFRLDTNLEYYYYSIEYLAAVDRFYVRGTYHDKDGATCDRPETTKGFAYLLDGDGTVVASHTKLEAMARESQPIVRSESDGSVTVVQPKLPSGYSVARVTATAVQRMAPIEDPYVWDYCGTDGIFLPGSRVLVASLSTKGMVVRTANVTVAATNDTSSAGDQGGAASAAGHHLVAIALVVAAVAW